jgi:hypothetical protein
MRAVMRVRIMPRAILSVSQQPRFGSQMVPRRPRTWQQPWTKRSATIAPGEAAAAAGIAKWSSEEISRPAPTVRRGWRRVVSQPPGT